MRKIDVEKVRAVLAGRDDGGIDNPRGAFDVGQRSPKVLKRKVAQRVAELAIEFSGACVAPERFAAVGIVDRGGRANQIGAGPFAVKREPDGGFELVIMLTE